MQQRNAAQTYYYFSLLLVGLLLSTVSRRLEPLCAVLPLGLLLIHSRLGSRRPVFTVRCTVSPLRAFEGDPVTVQLHLEATTAVPPTELWHLLPAGAMCVDGHPRVVLTLRPGETRTLRHQVVFSRRGTYRLGRLYARVHPGADLQPWLAEYHQEQTCHVYPRITLLPRPVSPLHTYISFGNYVSRTAGDGLEFAGVRPYVSGDRLRHVHWRTSLKRQQLYVNDYYCERNADVVILLDTLVALGSSAVTTLDLAVRAAASLAAHYLYNKDRVGLITYGGVCTWVPPALGQLQFHRILDTLLETRPHFSYLTKDLTLVPPRVLSPGALVFALTTLLDNRIEVALRDLLARDFPLILLVISPEHTMTPSRRPGQAEAAARLWRLETDLRVHEFRSLGVPVLVQDSPEPLSVLHAAVTRGRIWQRRR